MISTLLYRILEEPCQQEVILPGHLSLQWIEWMSLETPFHHVYFRAQLSTFFQQRSQNLLEAFLPLFAGIVQEKHLH